MKEKKNIKQSRILNLLVPHVINQNNQVNQEIKKRIKLNRIFNEFENKASNEFNYYINESNKRYNNLKNGFSLKDLLLDSKQKSIEQAHKILNDPIYVNLNLEKEKEKMRKIKTKDLNKNIRNIFSKIRQPENIDIEDLSQNNIISSKGDYSNYREYIYNVPNRYNNYDNKSQSIGKKVTFSTGKNNKLNFNKIYNININNDKDTLSSIFRNEEFLINKSFENYKHKIPKVEENSKLTFKEKEKIKIKLPRLKLLNYKSVRNIYKSEEKESNKNTIDYKYLLSFLDKNKNKKKIICNTPKNNIEDKEDTHFPYITEINNNQINNDTNYGSTLDIVVKSAKKELNKENDINDKINELEYKLGLEQTPKVHIYDEILRKKSETIKNERRQKALKILEKQKYSGTSKKDVINIKIDSKVKLLDIVIKNINKNNNKKF